MNMAISHEVGHVSPPSLEPKVRHGLNLTHSEFKQGHWCFDTPGTVSRDQVLDIYTLDELITLVPRKLMVPRIAVIHHGMF